ncbi:mitogen-activated protein kinase 15 [Perognathus longimembris pacificus]|uniref:mitogen-activated protein kinase 15 n=1 Tax=Perognathus longimembris pacificus TaxID=214514 RepID=UPI002018A4C2|nr:mitogen-activated protein kinase 15 [Perognathus longimembris pacificus]
MAAAEVDRHVAQRYQLQRRLGKGAYGIVWKAVDRRTGQVVAIKKIFDAFRDRTDAQRTFREVMILRAFAGHPNIIRLLAVVPAENDRDIYLVFESMDTDLHAVIQKGSLLDDAHKRYIFYQLLRATESIHSRRVIHRDQKPSNVLLDASCSVKLCDFGLARSLGDAPVGPEGQALTEYVATRWYRAPEVLLHSTRYTPGVDMWSLGCILGEMLRGRPLFQGSSALHQLELILETIGPPATEELSALGSDYSAWALRGGPRSGPRQTLGSLLPPDTPPEALDLLGRLLVWAPEKRLRAAEALRHPYVQRFHRPGPERTCGADVRIPEPQGDRPSAREYRRLLYRALGLAAGREEPRGCGAPGAPGRPAQTPAPHPRPGPHGVCAPPPPRSSGPVGDGGPRPEPRLELPIPQRPAAPPARSALPAGARAPGGGVRGGPAEPAGAGALPPQGEPGLPQASPSLASQAAAQGANRVLVRSHRARDCGQVAPRLPPEAPGARPGRRMFGSWVSQGAQGAAKAALGGYSQAYGTVGRSALGLLPALPRQPASPSPPCPLDQRPGPGPQAACRAPLQSP